MIEMIAEVLTRGIGGMQFAFWLSSATCLFSFYLEKRSHWQLRACAGIGIFLVAGFLTPTDETGILGMWAYAALFWLNAAVVMSFCKVSWAEALQCALYGYLTEHLASSVYVLFFVSKWSWNAAYSIISAAVYALIWLWAARKIAHDGHYHVKKRSLLLISFLTMLVTVVLSYQFKSTADPTATMTFPVESLRTMLQLSQWYAIAFCIVMLAVELTRQQQIQSQIELAASHELLRVHEQQYHMTKETIDLINRKCHDMKHQVSLLMEQQGGSEELRQRYSREILKTIEVYDTNIDTGNEVLNTILRDRSLYCSINDITWTCAAHGEVLDFMDPMDLAAIMGNAVDNAVEAVERIPDKKQQIISVQIAEQRNMVQILVENTFDGKLNRVGKQLLTRKEDRDYHGIGIKSIIATAEKYGGYATTNTEGNTFILNILIPIPTEKKG